jgi:anti-anti-sigma factor
LVRLEKWGRRSGSWDDRFVANQRVPDDDGTEGERSVPLEGSFAVGDVTLERRPDQTVVLLAGDVDLSLSDELSRACESAVDLALPIRLDLSAVTFVDSTALGFVARLASAERDLGRRLRVTGATRRTTETIRLIGLEELLDLD